MLGEVSGVWKDIGVYAATVTAVIVLLGLLTKARPVRYALRKLIGEPVVAWIQRDAVEPALTAHTEDVKSTVRQLLEAHTSAEEQLVHQLAETVGGLTGQLALAVDAAHENGVRLDAVQAEQTRVANALTQQ